MDYRRTYKSAAVSFADLVSRLPADRWDGPGLGDWTLRDLVGHTVSSALRQVPVALATPAGTVAVESAEAYWSLARTVAPDRYAALTAASALDARETGRALGDDPAARVGELIGRATQALAAAGDDDVIATAAGGMRVRDWLPTRTFELVVHGLDAAGAAGVEYVLATEAVADAAAQAARVAAAVGDGPLLLRALTGRGALPEKFSII